MAGLDFANVDWEGLAQEACGPNATWDGSQCVPNPPPDIDFEGLAAQYPDIFGGPGPLAGRQNEWGTAGVLGVNMPTMTGQGGMNFDALVASVLEQSSGPYDPYNEDSTKWGQYSEGFNAADAVPAAPAATTEPAAVDMYQQQGIVSPGISDAEQAWLDAAIAGGTFTGDLGQVPAEQVMGGWDPSVDLGGATLDDPRIQMRIDLAESLLDQGHTVADIEQFMGMESLLTDEELGTVKDTMVDPSFAGVGSQDWFEFVAEDEEYMSDPVRAAGVTDALARIEETTTATETGTATIPWVDSPEFAAAFGSPAGDAGGGAVEQPGDAAAGGFVCPPGQEDIGFGVCMPIGWNTPAPAGDGGDGGDGAPAGDGGDGGDGAPAGDGGGDGGDGGDGATLFDTPPGDDSDWADPFGDDDVPPGVPVYVNEQVDAINIVRNQLKDIKDAHAKLLKSGLANIDGVEQALTDAESDIYAKQYGVLGPDGEVLTPGEMDRLLSTWEARRSTSKKNRTIDREEILSIMTDEGVPAGLAKTELDMIQAIHGDSIDAQYDYIESLWRIGKMSHDERTSMIGNMMSSYRLQLRDTLVEMVMAEEISTAGEIGDIRQTALEADTMAGLFEGMTENEVFALMSSGMSDLLQLPDDKEIGMIPTGEWAGYTSGQKANVLITAGYTQNADGTFSPPAADADPTGMITTGEWAGYTKGEKADVLIRAGYTQNADGTFTAPAADAADDDKVLSKLMPDGSTWSGTADEYYDEHGEYIFAAGDEEITQDLPDGTPFTGTVADYVARSGVYPFAAAAEQDDPNTFTVSVDRINELDPTGAWLRGSGLQVVGARKDSAQRPGSTGFVTMNWDDWVFTEEPYEAVKDPEKEDRVLSTVVGDQPWRGTAQQFLEEYGRPIFDDPNWGKTILDTTVDGKPWSGTADEYFDQHGLYIFGEEVDAPVPLPSGISTTDFPALKIAFPDVKITNEAGELSEVGEYWFSPEMSAVYHQIMEIRDKEDPDTRREDLGGWLVDGPYDDTGVNWPVDARNMVQQEASRLSQDPTYAGFAAVDLSLSAVLANAGRDGPQSTLSGTDAGSFNAAEGLYVFSRLAARYLQKDVPVYDTPPKAGNHTGYISFETGEFVPNPSYTTP